jgi:hypothetical protein
MNTFSVWIQPFADLCEIRVLGIENAKWLLSRLITSVLVNSSETVNEEECFPRCTFRVPYSSSTFEKLLAGIPEVRVMFGLT